MWKRLCVVSALAASLFFAVSIPRAGAKPADLPYQEQIECNENGDPPAQSTPQIELDIASKGIKLGAGLAPCEAAPAIDAVLPAYVEQWLQHMGDLFIQPKRGVSWEAIGNMLPFTRGLVGMAPATAHPSDDHRDLRNRSVPLGLVELWY